MKLCEKGCHVKLISVTKVRRSHSVCAQGGINIAVNLKGEDDSPIIHAYDTIKGGDFLANQPPVLEMCLAGPAIFRMMDRIGVPFNRTPEGPSIFDDLEGLSITEPLFAALRPVSSFSIRSMNKCAVMKPRAWSKNLRTMNFCASILDEEGRARGIVMHDLFNLKLDVLKADAVVIATGGLGLIYKKSTNSTFCTGAANGRLFMQGMKYANGEFIQIHPTAIPGSDKMRLISESSAAKGAVFGFMATL